MRDEGSGPESNEGFLDDPGSASRFERWMIAAGLLVLVGGLVVAGGLLATDFFGAGSGPGEFTPNSTDNLTTGTPTTTETTTTTPTTTETTTTTTSTTTETPTETTTSTTTETTEAPPPTAPTETTTTTETPEDNDSDGGLFPSLFAGGVSTWTADDARDPLDEWVDAAGDVVRNDETYDDSGPIDSLFEDDTPTPEERTRSREARADRSR